MTLKKTLLAAVAVVVGTTAVAPAIASAAGKNPEKRIIRLIKKADLNGDGLISQAELSKQIARTVAFLDANGDGAVSSGEIANQKALVKAENKRLKASSGQKLMKLPKGVAKHFERFDVNGDGKLTAAELNAVAAKMFSRRDRNKDGYLSRDDFAA